MTRMVIVLEGGLVQCILADGPVEYLIKDFDTEGSDEIFVDEDGVGYCSNRGKIIGDEWRERVERVDEIFNQDDKRELLSRTVIIEERIVSVVSIPHDVPEKDVIQYVTTNGIQGDNPISSKKIIERM